MFPQRHTGAEPQISQGPRTDKGQVVGGESSKLNRTVLKGREKSGRKEENSVNFLFLEVEYISLLTSCMALSKSQAALYCDALICKGAVVLGLAL